MFAAIAVLGLVFGFQVGKLYKYNNLLFNLLFLFMDGISRPKSISRYGKYTFHQITKFVLTNLHCQRKITIDGSRKTMNFIVLPCNVIKVLNLWNTMQSLFQKHTKYLAKFQII